MLSVNPGQRGSSPAVTPEMEKRQEILNICEKQTTRTWLAEGGRGGVQADPRVPSESAWSASIAK